MIPQSVSRLRRTGFQAILLSCLASITAGAGAALPITPPESFLELEAISAHAREVLFLLQYSLQPVCAEKGDLWSGGIDPEIVFPKEPSASGMKKRWEILQQTFGAKPGQFVFLVDQPLTPYGVAGIRAGDIVDAALNRPRPGDAPGDAADKGGQDSAPAPRPADKQPAGSVLERARALNKMLSEQAERIYSRNPIRNMTVLRNGVATPVAVRMVRTCRIHLIPVDSKYSYADSDNNQVIMTKPLLQSLSHAELVAVIAHEAAHVALDLSKDRVSGRLTAKLFFGKLAGIGENVETETSAPKDAELIQADRLAMRMATGLGVEPAAYVATLRKLVASGETLGRPDYERTRPMNPARLEALEKNVQLWEEGKRYYPPGKVALEKVREAYARAVAVSQNPNLAFVPTLPPAPGANLARQAAPKAAGADADAPEVGANAAHSTLTEPVSRVQSGQSRWVPPDTGYARLDDVGAVPVRDEGKARYQHFLTLPTPRAFVVGEKGGWRFWWRDPRAIAKAIDYCEKSTTKCWLYVVDDRVVWHPDAERRIGRTEQLQEKP